MTLVTVKKSASSYLYLRVSRSRCNDIRKENFLMRNFGVERTFKSFFMETSDNYLIS